MDLPFMVDSIDLSAVFGRLQSGFSGQCSSADLLAVMLKMMDSLNFNLKSLHNQ